MVDPHQLMPLQLECTLYFEENPYAYETVDGLAVRLGRKPEDLKKILDRLVSLHILEMIGEGVSAIYHYNQPKIITRIDLSCERV